MRLFAAMLFTLGALLTFNDAAFEFAKRFTDRPEILPVTLMVPFVYLIFQVVLWHLDRDEDSIEEKFRFEARRAEVTERRLDRRAIVDAFTRSVDGLPEYNVHRGTAALAEWIADEAESAIEVLVLAYSSETFLDGCLGAASRVEAMLADRGRQPAKIVFKLLTRDPKTTWRLPFLPIREADDEYRHALTVRFDQFLARWTVELFEAFSFLPKDRVELEARWYPFEPMYKAAIVNRKVGLLGIYNVHEVHNKGVSGWDYHGHGAKLYEIRADGGATVNGQRALKSVVDLFDEIWTRHSRMAELV